VKAMLLTIVLKKYLLGQVQDREELTLLQEQEAGV